MLNDGTITIDSLDTFTKVLTQWHAQRVAELEHLLEIPDGTEAQLDDGTPIILEGPAKAGFLIGLNAALSHLGKLPFVAEYEEETDE